MSSTAPYQFKSLLPTRRKVGQYSGGARKAPDQKQKRRNLLIVEVLVAQVGVIRDKKAVVDGGLVGPAVLELVKGLLGVHIDVEILVIVVAHDGLCGRDAVRVGRARLAHALARAARVGAGRVRRLPQIVRGWRRRRSGAGPRAAGERWRRWHGGADGGRWFRAGTEALDECCSGLQLDRQGRRVMSLLSTGVTRSRLRP